MTKDSTYKCLVVLSVYSKSSSDGVSSLDSRFSNGIREEYIRNLVTRLKWFEFINLHTRHVALQSVQLKQQANLQTNARNLSSSTLWSTTLTRHFFTSRGNGNFFCHQINLIKNSIILILKISQKCINKSHD